MSSQGKIGQTPPVGVAEVHDSNLEHLTGQAIYCDDILEPRGCLHAALVLGPRVPSRALRVQAPDEGDLEKLSVSRHIFCSGADIPGENNAGPVVHDEPLLPINETTYSYQPVGVVLSEDREDARRIARMYRVNGEPLDSVVSTIAEAAEVGQVLHEPLVLENHFTDSSLNQCPYVTQCGLSIGGQDHVYLEGQVALVVPSSDGIHVVSSTQHPTEVQDLIANLLDVNAATVTVEIRRMGGAFGGKESQAAHFAMLAALGAHLTGLPVKLRLDRDDDMRITGKRHDFLVNYKVGHDADGLILAADIELSSRCGWSSDLSRSVNDRALFHAENAYFIPSIRITSNRYKTHTVSNTAFRGFGGPQGMVGIERCMDVIAKVTGKDPLDVRLLNLYGVSGRETPYGMSVYEDVLPELIQRLADTSNYRSRRKEIDLENAQMTRFRRGIALTPVKFGISFTASFLNQAGALLNVYKDGSVSINHGGTEMGQGLHTKIRQVVAAHLGIEVDSIQVTSTRTDKVPNTSPTAASSGSDLNGMAALVAATKIRNRLEVFLQETYQTSAEAHFSNGAVEIEDHKLTFADLARRAWFARVPLSATGHYATPDIGWDPATGKGRPFYYFANGAAVTEVEIDTLTGVSKVLRADILHDVGKSLNPLIDLGQIEGGYIQGMGWLTSEELVYSTHGELMTHGLSTYKIPTATDRPQMNIELWDGANPREMLYQSKAVGEPPFMLAISVHSAICHAISSLSPDSQFWPQLNAPATPQEILRCVQCAKTGS
ncbi:MAG: xanthine dehydrogenase molybdopterin binding subunit [Gammaproteobacteria bacterium]|mgnify:CR=1 FL=1|nr:xanthine dehydrogenase molybdopterin binding subunit [Gammaproteobacteria bacterium]OUX75675.1 MAG: xanthine dehydrogenase molybdopterin binding subunit [Oceanospirillales bacterium TMED59]